jgi:hypothetical protein
MPVRAEPAPVDPDPNFPRVWEADSLFGETPKQLALPGITRLKARVTSTVDRQRPVPLANLDDWLDFAEALLGRQDRARNSLADEHFETLSALEELEDQLESEFYLDMDPVWRLGERFPWLDTVEKIAADQGFFHWELRFASIFSEGGFDIQVGNPPWVRPIWEEDSVLAEFEPWFELTENMPVPIHYARKAELLNSQNANSFYISELTAQTGQETFVGSLATYDLLAGTQPDLYRAFMIRTWKNIGSYGTVGLLHPDTHFVGEREKAVRSQTYQRLRVHGDFVNAGQRFFPKPVSHARHFGIHIYGHPQPIGFPHLSWLTDAGELQKSLVLAESGEIPDGWDYDSGAPSVRYAGDWDSRPHPARVIHVDLSVLALWQRLIGDNDVPADQGRLLYPVSTEEQDAIEALSGYQVRIQSFNPQISSGFHESGAKKDGLIRKELTKSGDWRQVILQGIQIGLANPMFKSPAANSNDTFGLDLVAMPIDATPESEYQRASDISQYEAAQEHWIDHRTSTTRRYTDFYRLAWRRQISSNSERSLYAAIIPPGPAHVHLVHSMVLTNNHSTALAAGFWASLPLDYFVRITGTGDLQTRGAKALPFGSLDHPLAPALLLRTMRLNCLTSAYEDLWAEVYDDAWLTDSWAYPWKGLPALSAVRAIWEQGAPLRTERARRAALVEIDALIAVWLGIDVDALIAMYHARFPVMSRFEEAMWFDAKGWKLAGYHRTYGQVQQKDSWEQFQSYLEDRDKNPPPDGYTPPFYKADRIGEYRQAHAAFSARLAAAATLKAPGQRSEGDR